MISLHSVLHYLKKLSELIEQTFNREGSLYEACNEICAIFFLPLYTVIRPRGHSRQVGAASVSTRQKKL